MFNKQRPQQKQSQEYRSKKTYKQKDKKQLPNSQQYLQNKQLITTRPQNYNDSPSQQFKQFPYVPKEILNENEVYTPTSINNRLKKLMLEKFQNLQTKIEAKLVLNEPRQCEDLDQNSKKLNLVAQNSALKVFSNYKNYQEKLNDTLADRILSYSNNEYKNELRFQISNLTEEIIKLDDQIQKSLT